MGSILFTAEVGKTYEKGDELGYFAFGGSTCIAIFQKDTVVVDEDIISNRSACVLNHDDDDDDDNNNNNNRDNNNKYD